MFVVRFLRYGWCLSGIVEFTFLIYLRYDLVCGAICRCTTVRIAIIDAVQVSYQCAVRFVVVRTYCNNRCGARKST